MKIQKKKKKPMVCGCSSVVNHMPSMCKALGLTQHFKRSGGNSQIGYHTKFYQRKGRIGKEAAII
jgi:hypothetical protein